MYEDVPSSIMLDKAILIQLVNQNVIPRFLNTFIKGQSLLPFFYICYKICSKVSIFCALRTIFINILILPLYFFIPIGGLFIFIFVNGYFISKEFLGNFLIQFHKKNYVDNFYSKRSAELYFLGCVIAFLYTIPLINFFIPFISNVLFSNIILENKTQIKN